jgi:hypothetical protein
LNVPQVPSQVPSGALPPGHPAVSDQEVKRLVEHWIVTQNLHHAPRVSRRGFACTGTERRVAHPSMPTK